MRTVVDTLDIHAHRYNQHYERIWLGKRKVLEKAPLENVDNLILGSSIVAKIESDSTPT